MPRPSGPGWSARPAPPPIPPVAAAPGGPRARSRRAGCSASQPPATAWPACALRAPVEAARRARGTAGFPRRDQPARAFHPQHPKHHPHGGRKCPELVSGTLTADSSHEGTVTALTVITVTSTVFLGETAAGFAT